MTGLQADSCAWCCATRSVPSCIDDEDAARKREDGEVKDLARRVEKPGALWAATKQTGLYQYNHRYYSPSQGRFINRDPIAEHGGVNLYAYCGNDPVGHYDYLGQFSFKKLFKKIAKFISPIISVVTTMIGMPFVGALINTAISAISGASFKDLAIGFGIGAVAGYVGGGVSSSISRSLGMNLRDLGTSLLRGGLTGGLSGAGTAMVYGQNVWSGFKNGAAMGMATSTAIWGWRESQSTKFIRRIRWDDAKDGQKWTSERKLAMEGIIRDAGQSPLGQEQFRAFFERGNQPFPVELGSFAGGGFEMRFDPRLSPIDYLSQKGADANLQWVKSTSPDQIWIHEMGHAVFGLNDTTSISPPNSFEVIGEVATTKNNVTRTENVYRSWAGGSLRPDYHGVPVPSLPLWHRLLAPWRANPVPSLP